jgi:hypothetical protein
MPILVGTEEVAAEAAGMEGPNITGEDPAAGTAEVPITVAEAVVGTVADTTEVPGGGVARGSPTVLGGRCSAFKPCPRSLILPL